MVGGGGSGASGISYTGMQRVAAKLLAVGWRVSLRIGTSTGRQAIAGQVGKKNNIFPTSLSLSLSTSTTMVD